MNIQESDILDFLQKEQLRGDLVQGIRAYREKYSRTEPEHARMSDPHFRYYGPEIWEQAVTALLCGSNILLVGTKATGKNVLAENLACAFGRPYWTVSFHINMDSSFMIGTDTFENGQVVFRPGPVYECAVHGGFGILDEINMARNEALAVLHSLLDYRRVMDIPGYEVIHVDEAARFIGTMNCGYAGTRELNEALASRFAVIDLPVIRTEDLEKMLRIEFPSLKQKAVEQFAGLYSDLQKKSANAEISDRSVDLRGLIDAVRFMESGLSPAAALRMGISNKCFDENEAMLVNDVMSLRIPERLDRSSLFSD